MQKNYGGDDGGGGNAEKPGPDWDYIFSWRDPQHNM